MSVSVDIELKRQTEALVELGYPRLTGLGEDAFRSAAAALSGPLAAYRAEGTTEPTHAWFVLVPNRSLVPVSARVGLLSLAGRVGTLSRHFADVDSFRPVLDLPDAPVYAVVGVERGDEFCGVRPSEAAPIISERGRTMLTMEEGMAFLHACPEALVKNKCFHTAGSRSTDARVPALWIAERAPHLGWCWWNNHHSWLGVASAETRITPAT